MSDIHKIIRLTLAKEQKKHAKLIRMKRKLKML